MFAFGAAQASLSPTIRIVVRLPHDERQEQAQPSLLAQQHDTHRGNGLGHGRDPEGGIRGHWYGASLVQRAGRAEKQQALAVRHRRHHTGRRMALSGGLEQSIDFSTAARGER